MPDPVADPLAALEGSRARPRARIAVGAAVVLFVVAVAASAVVSFLGGGGGAQGELVPAASVDHVGEVDAEGAAVAGGPAGGAAGILVHVLGAVGEPGIVELAPGARVVDAIAAAGGLAADADPAGVNLARALVDGEQLVVPKVGEVPPPAAAPAAGGTAGQAGTGGRVSLNTADVAALDTLPRIGPALAQRIIDWREANGPFTEVSQLLEVAGIGDAVYSGLVDLVSL